MKQVVSRRRFLALGAGFLSVVPSWRRTTAQDSLPGAGPSGKLWDPARAGPSIEPVTARDNDAAIQAIEKRLQCQCGTCKLDVYTCRTTDFTCPVSPEMHHRVLALAEQGQSAEQIQAEFVGQYGEQVLMAPPRRGFNLAGYLMPSVGILAVGALLVLAMRRWTRTTESDAAPGPASDPPASPAELERLQRELDRMDA